MAKKGTFYPWRIAFAYPDGPKGVDHLIHSEDSAVRKASELLYRGADVEIRTVDEATRQQTVWQTLRAADFDFTGWEDGDLGDYNTPLDLAHDTVYERLYGKPTERAVHMAQQALANRLRDNTDLAIKNGQQALTEATLSGKDLLQAPNLRSSALIESPAPPVAYVGPESLPEPEETKRAREILNEEIAAEHQAVAEALSDKGLLRHGHGKDQHEEKPMNLIWIITRVDDECDYSVLDSDDPITATVEDAREAFIAAVRESPGSLNGYDIALEAIPTEPGDAVTWGRFEDNQAELVLTCRQVASGLHAARLQARRAELEKELTRINQQLADKNTEAAQIDQELEMEAPWNA